jgi:hypothetical protein
MADYLTMVSIFLSIASTTLAIAAFIFSWVTFKSTSKIQIDAQAILAQISEKVEVVVDKTSHQIDKAWDYFTSHNSSSLPKSIEVANKKLDDLKNQIIGEARKEITESIKRFSPEIDKELFKAMIMEEVEKLVGRSTQQTKQLMEREALILKIAEIQAIVMKIAIERGYKLDQGTSFMTFLKQFDFLPSNIKDDIITLCQFHDIKNRGTLTEERIQKYFRMAESLINFLRIKHSCLFIK